MASFLLDVAFCTNQVPAQRDLCRYWKETKACKTDVYLLPKQPDEKGRTSTFLHSVRRSLSLLRIKPIRKVSRLTFTDQVLVQLDFLWNLMETKTYETEVYLLP